eukprot:6328322-Pyramimonas_sp.AAC.1
MIAYNQRGLILHLRGPGLCTSVAQRGPGLCTSVGQVSVLTASAAPRPVTARAPAIIVVWWRESLFPLAASPRTRRQRRPKPYSANLGDLARAMRLRLPTAAFETCTF